MALPVYAQRQNVIDPNGNIIGGMLYAFKEIDKLYHDFTSARQIKLSLVPNGSGVFTPVYLYSMENGVNVYMEYNLVDPGTERYNLTWRYLFKNQAGTVIKTFGNYFVQQPFNSAQAYRPFINSVQFVSGVRYSNNPAVAGDPAAQVSIPGPLYWEKPGVIDAPVLSGSMPNNEVESEWVWSNPVSMDSTDYDTFKATIINGGDGTDPFTNEDAPDEDGPDPSQPGGGDYPTGGGDTGGGGGGDSPDGGDSVDFPALPTTTGDSPANVIRTGLISMYNPTAAQLRSLATVLWSNDFESSIRKILNDPFDGIIGLSLIPVTPHTTGTEECKIGNFNSEVQMPLVDQQYLTIDCGSLQIKENWNNALDYSPTTAIDIFLPYVGIKRLNTEDVMNKTVALKYNIDLLSGAGVAMLKCGDKVLYTYPCKISYDVPLTGSNKAALYTGMINVAMSAIGGAAAGGALGAVGGAATSAIQTATSKQSSIERSGSITSNTGILGEFTPYVILHRPIQSMPAKFKNIKGYQSNITSLLKSLKGYTEVDYIHLEKITGATDTELKEIEDLLKKGVII